MQVLDYEHGSDSSTPRGILLRHRNGSQNQDAYALQTDREAWRL
jgi:hypothetical protein